MFSMRLLIDLEAYGGCSTRFDGYRARLLEGQGLRAKSQKLKAESSKPKAESRKLKAES
jgi:hypothetical protein